MEKIRKIYLKDYTNALEKVLEKKNFSIETKNLLLSMFYKIENAYQDYLKVKVEVYDKGVFLEDLIDIIDVECNEIEIVDSIKEENKGYIVQKEEGKIVSIGSEFTLLNALIELGQETICMPEEENILQEPITYFINLGMRMHQSEIIRDFNGWSWEIILKDIADIEMNIYFQTFLYLLGYEFIDEWQQNDTNLADYIILAYEKLKQDFGEERAKTLMQLFCKLAIEAISKVSKEQAEFWKERKKETKIELEKLNNKKSYLEGVTQEKKELNKKIDKIDKLINNKEELEKEYKKRNEKLPNKEKIFSIRHLVNMLEEERLEYVKQIKKCNDLIDPKGYVARKEMLNIRNEFLETLNITDENIESIDIANLFLECFEIKISKAQTRQEIISYFYILRYYGFLIYNSEGENLKQKVDLKELFEKVIILLIEKANKLNAIEEVTDDTQTNDKIIKKLFNSKMIDLNNLVIETKVVDGTLVVEYYDTNILESSYEIECGKTIKLKKKTKLFT